MDWYLIISILLFIPVAYAIINKFFSPESCCDICNRRIYKYNGKWYHERLMFETHEPKPVKIDGQERFW